MEKSEFISPKQTAAILGRSYAWLLRNPGNGPPFYVIGKRRVYREQEVMGWVRSRRVEAACIA
jgi:hypothetical protein